jgi:hypothetical protein
MSSAVGRDPGVYRDVAGLGQDPMQARSTTKAPSPGRCRAENGDAMMTAEQSLTTDEAATLDRYWRAANYLAAGQIYLLDNALLTEPLRPEHIKPRLLGP